MPPLISVIVPIYNTELYLRECIDSIINQTYTNLEIILVDDGSTDNSPQICDEYAKKDPRVKVIHKPNGGLSSARNAGLDIAKGDYIGFVDSDDIVRPEMYETLYKFTDKNAFITSCEIATFNDENALAYHLKKVELNSQENVDIIPASSYLEYFAKNISILSKLNVTCKLFPATLIQEVRFPVGRNCEDFYFMYKLSPNILSQQTSLKTIRIPLYLYRINLNSISTSKSQPIFIDSIKNIYEIYKENKFINPSLAKLVFLKFIEQTKEWMNIMIKDPILYQKYYEISYKWIKVVPYFKLLNKSNPLKIKDNVYYFLLKYFPIFLHKYFINKELH